MNSECFGLATLLCNDQADVDNVTEGGSRGELHLTVSSDRSQTEITNSAFFGVFIVVKVFLTHLSFSGGLRPASK